MPGAVITTTVERHTASLTLLLSVSVVLDESVDVISAFCCCSAFLASSNINRASICELFLMRLQDVKFHLVGVTGSGSLLAVRVNDCNMLADGSTLGSTSCLRHLRTRLHNPGPGHIASTPSSAL